MIKYSRSKPQKIAASDWQNKDQMTSENLLKARGCQTSKSKLFRMLKEAATSKSCSFQFSLKEGEKLCSPVINYFS